METTDLDRWLAAYGRAWEQKDAHAFSALFTPDVHYHWTPFEQPGVGREALAEAFEAAVARQSEIRFTASALTGGESSLVACWRCSFRRVGAEYTVRLDGIFLMDFADDGLCRVFREWWHSDEGKQEGGVQCSFGRAMESPPPPFGRLRVVVRI